MCGLVGVVGDITMKETEVFHHMLHLDVCRGPDSTGITAVSTLNETKVIKGLGTPFELYSSMPEEFTDTRFPRIKGSHKLLMGHNRWATSGEINEDNAHPFVRGKIVGQHNGTLTKMYLKNLPDHKDFDVDSDNIMHAINLLGIKEAVSKMHGAWALNIYDTTDKVLSLIRNKERPLWLCWDDRKKALFWASERWMLETALSRANIKYEEPWSLKTNTLLQVDLSKGWSIKDKLTVTQDVEGWEEPPFRSTTGSRLFGGTNYNSRISYNNAQSNKPNKGDTISIVAAANEIKKGTGSVRYLEVACIDQRHNVKFGRMFVWRPDQEELAMKIIKSEGFFSGEWGLSADHTNPRFEFFLSPDTVGKEYEWGEIDPDTLLPYGSQNKKKEPEEDQSSEAEARYEIINGYGEVISEEKFLECADDGCIWCSSPIGIEDHNKVGWCADGMVCYDCMSTAESINEIEKYVQIGTKNITKEK